MAINSFQVTGVNPWAAHPYIEATKNNQNFFGAMANALFDKENGVLSNIDQGIRKQNTNEMINEVNSLSDQELKNIYDSGSNPYEYTSRKLGTGFIYNPYDENLTKAVQGRDSTFRNDQTNIAFNEVLAKPESEIREHIANGGTVFDLYNQDNKPYIKPLNDKQNATFMLMQSEGQNTLKEKDFNDAQAYISQLPDKARDLIYQGKWDEAKSMEGVDPNKLDLLKRQLGNLTIEGRNNINVPLAQAYNDKEAKYISDQIANSLNIKNEDGSLKYNDLRSMFDFINFGYTDIKNRRGDSVSEVEAKKAIANNIPEAMSVRIMEDFFSRKDGAPREMLERVLNPNSNMDESERNIFLNKVLNGYKSYLKANFGNNTYFQEKAYNTFSQRVADQAKQTGITINAGLKDLPRYHIQKFEAVSDGFSRAKDIAYKIRKKGETDGRSVYRSDLNFDNGNKIAIANALISHIRSTNPKLNGLLDKVYTSGIDSGVTDFIIDLAKDEFTKDNGGSITSLKSSDNASDFINNVLKDNTNSKFNELINQDRFARMVEQIYYLDKVAESQDKGNLANSNKK